MCNMNLIHVVSKNLSVKTCSCKEIWIRFYFKRLLEEMKDQSNADMFYNLYCRCAFDMRKPSGPILTNLMGVITFVCFIVNVLSYVGIWWKLHTVSKSSRTSGAKYQRTARIMVLFIVVFFAQWWGFSLYVAWQQVTPCPPLEVLMLMLWFTNFGGVFNAVAFTFVRRRYKAVGQTEATKMESSVNSQIHTKTTNT